MSMVRAGSSRGKARTELLLALTALLDCRTRGLEGSRFALFAAPTRTPRRNASPMQARRGFGSPSWFGRWWCSLAGSNVVTLLSDLSDQMGSELFKGSGRPPGG